MEPLPPFGEEELAALRLLARDYPSLESILAEIAALSAELTLPKPAVHVISDVHGEHAKLRHVVNNASGALREVVERIFADAMSPDEIRRFLTLVFYPKETLDSLAPELTDPAARREFARTTLRRVFRAIRHLSRRYSLTRAASVFPPEYRTLLGELLHEHASGDGAEFGDAIIDSQVEHGNDLHLIRITARVLRNLAIDELVLAGDCWDRGPRGDRVVDYLMRLPNVAFTWGNHDVEWIGACLGHEALICSALRVSLRYRRLGQLEEGYGIPVSPLERLARRVYGDDPAERFVPRGEGLRETIAMARMQKAAAVMQFKLEGKLIERNPEFGMDARRLLHRIDREAGTVEVDGRRYPLLDRSFPTIDPARPYDLSDDEAECLERIRKSFLASQALWEQVKFMVERGSMYVRRDRHLIFHGCVPCDASGDFLPLTVDGEPRRGKAMFDAIDRVVRRALDRRETRDLDFLWYLWCGERSPLFGKDRIATFERDLIEDKAAHHEEKNDYFRLIHEAEFCEKVLAEFGVDPFEGLIVNGHVPVKIEKGESPVKKCGKAVTIDGAFSEAYGDHGYTLVLEADRTRLARHHHFESVEAAVRDGVDIIPTVETLREWSPARRVADTEKGEAIRRRIAWLRKLARAYREGNLRAD